jgi:hypothetical protein
MRANLNYGDALVQDRGVRSDWSLTEIRIQAVHAQIH